MSGMFRLNICNDISSRTLSPDGKTNLRSRKQDFKVSVNICHTVRGSIVVPPLDLAQVPRLRISPDIAMAASNTTHLYQVASRTLNHSPDEDGNPINSSHREVQQY